MQPADGHDVRATVSRWRELTRAVDRDGEATGSRVLVVASFTANSITPALGVGLAGVDGSPPAIAFADYNQIFQVCLQPGAHAAADSDADEVVVLWRIEDVFERDFLAWSNGDDGAHDRLLDGATALGRALRDLIESRTKPVIVSDAPTPIGFGLDHRDPAELTALIGLQHELNAALDTALAETGVERLRLAALQTAHGSLATFDRRNWVMSREPFAHWFAHVIGAAVADVVGARTHVPPKVLALDADGTLWDGVLVDDGIGGLDCSDAFPGFAHRSFQVAVQRLRHRGVLVAIVSKNDPEAIEAVFDQLDGMVLTGADIAGRRVSWDPKPGAIVELAGEFSLGLDSFVFVDDSDYELGAVATVLPSVKSLRVPDEIEALPDLLAESGLFRMMRVTDDDRLRTARVREQSGRTAAATSMSHAEFLDSLGLRVQAIRVGGAELGRVTQLVNKTNQFNLTTIRRSEAELEALVADPSSDVLAFTVDDRFGEYGIVGVTIVTSGNDGPTLDTVLMSCRVLGRGVESAMLAATVESARRAHPGDVTGRYRPTSRNAMVAALLTDHGFELDGDDGDGTRTYRLPAGLSVDVPAHITRVGP